jgi:hypothetical protein
MLLPYELELTSGLLVSVAEFIPLLAHADNSKTIINTKQITESTLPFFINSSILALLRIPLNHIPFPSALAVQP